MSEDFDLRIASLLTDRLAYSRAMGLTYSGSRDLATVFGYKDHITVQEYRHRYERGGIAGRIVDALPKATWRGGVELIEDENPDTITAFEQEWMNLETRLRVTAKLQAVDILSRLSTYAVLLIGAPGEVMTELPKGQPGQVLYLTPFLGSGALNSQRRTFEDALQGISQADVVIDSLDTEPTSPRFGLPLGYRLRRTNFSPMNEFSTKVVHWTRILHVAEGCLDDEVYGHPALERVWNYLEDLDKVVGGGAEAFYQRANQGRLWNLDKDAKGLTPAQLEDFRTQIEEWEHGIGGRNVRAKGVEVTALGSDVANFSNPADAILTVIAGAVGIPKRILTGSEMGELASSQDRDNWRDQVNGRRETHAGPYILTRLADRLIEYGYLPTPEQYTPRWGTVMNLTEDEKRAKALGMAQVNATQKSIVFLDSEIREQSYEFAPLTPEQITEQVALQTAAQPTEPQPAAGGAFPRAAEDAVERLAAAIEADDMDAVREILAHD